MKIAYLVYYDVTKEDGVVKKINSQVSEWQTRNIYVQIFAFVPNFGESTLDARIYPIGGNWMINRFIKVNLLLNELELFKPDLIYFRGETWNRTVGKLFKKYPSVVEVNTDQSSEFKLRMFQEKSLKSFFRYLGNYIFSHMLYKNAQGIVGVTNEITSKFPERRLKTTTIPNSIAVKNIKRIKKTGLKKTSLFFMGSPNQAWHGVDIIENIALNLPEIDFHIIGISKENKNNLFYHGYLDFGSYIKILENCQIGIGSLALFRNNMKEACPIKVREYIALGFPVIIGYQDTAFINERPEWVHIMDPQNIDFNSLKNFIEKYKNYLVKDTAFIDSEILEEKRLNFLKNVLERRD